MAQTIDSPRDGKDNTTRSFPRYDLQTTVKNAAQGVLVSVEDAGYKVVSNGQSMMDKFFPQDKRASFFASLKEFVLANPKVSAFLGLNLVLTGIPLGFFLLFSVSTFFFSLVVSILLGLVAAIGFTVLAVGAALLIVLPTIFFTTGVACLFFFWGLVGYYILRWTNGDWLAKQPSGGEEFGALRNHATEGSLVPVESKTRVQHSKLEINGHDNHSVDSTSQSAGTIAKPNTQLHEQLATTPDTHNRSRCDPPNGVDARINTAGRPINAMEVASSGPKVIIV